MPPTIEEGPEEIAVNLASRVVLQCESYGTPEPQVHVFTQGKRVRTFFMVRIVYILDSVEEGRISHPKQRSLLSRQPDRISRVRQRQSGRLWRVHVHCRERGRKRQSNGRAERAR